MLHILPKPLPTIIPNGLGIMLTTDGNILLHSKRYRRAAGKYIKKKIQYQHNFSKKRPILNSISISECLKIKLC